MLATIAPQEKLRIGNVKQALKELITLVLTVVSRYQQLACTHPRRPNVAAGVVTCPDCHQQWRIRWWQAQCTPCQRHVLTKLHFGRPQAAHAHCAHCHGHQFTLHAKWHVDYFTARLAACQRYKLCTSHTG